MPIQPSHFIRQNKLGWHEGNAVKYICRHTLKGGRKDIEKAIHYLELILEEDYNNDEHDTGTRSHGTIAGYSFYPDYQCDVHVDGAGEPAVDSPDTGSGGVDCGPVEGWTGHLRAGY